MAFACETVGYRMTVGGEEDIPEGKKELREPHDFSACGEHRSSGLLT
jgi:hypothetical protein